MSKYSTYTVIHEYFYVYKMERDYNMNIFYALINIAQNALASQFIIIIIIHLIMWHIWNTVYIHIHHVRCYEKM